MTSIYRMSEEEREQYLSSINTSIEVVDALTDIAEEDGCTFDEVWENGNTPKAGDDEVLARVRAHILANVPEDELRGRYFWGETAIDMGMRGEMREAAPAPDTYTLHGYQILDKVAKFSGGTAARVYVPKAWGGKRVKVVLVDP